MDDSGILGYCRRLDMKTGVLTRTFTLRAASGKELEFKIRRLVSLTNKHLAAISYTVTPLNFSGPIRILSAIDGNVSNMVAEDDPRVGAGFSGRVLSVTGCSAENTSLRMSSRTGNTAFTVACAAEHSLFPAESCTVTPVIEDTLCALSIEVNLEQGKPFTLEKSIGYADDKFCSTEEALAAAERAAKAGAAQGFEALITEQTAYLKEFWDSADVVIEGNEELNQAMKLNLFQLLQSVGRDGRTNIAAKGLSGDSPTSRISTTIPKTASTPHPWQVPGCAWSTDSPVCVQTAAPRFSIPSCRKSLPATASSSVTAKAFWKFPLTAPAAASNGFQAPPSQ